MTDYSEDGVDLTLIRWMLSLTPAQRLQFLQDRMNSILRSVKKCRGRGMNPMVEEERAPAGSIPHRTQ